MSDQVSLATATGPLWLALASHYAAGLVAIVTGFAALLVAKGGTAHKRVGAVFTYSMMYMAVMASGIAAYEGRSTSIVAAAVVLYMVVTATRALRAPGIASRALDVGLMLVAVAIAGLCLTSGYRVLGLPGRQLDGVPAVMMLFMGTVFALAAVGDGRMIRTGSITGTRRLARHLWRMCFALFIASGSFFLGQMDFVPAAMRHVPLLAALGVSPLVVLLYWMWRVRLRKRLAGMIVGGRAASAT